MNLSICMNNFKEIQQLIPAVYLVILASCNNYSSYVKKNILLLNIKGIIVNN
jgi:hypothetical protein